MSQPAYCSIPDTSDTDYWIKTYNHQDRSTSFVPKDKELHRQLKQQARQAQEPV